MHIELRHIHKRFGSVHANNDINLTFGSGRIVGILGENGAGKSTLMKILSGYQTMDSGEIALNGQPVHLDSPQTAIRCGIGMLQQDPLDVAAFTVLENFIYGLPLPGGPLLNRRAARAHLRAACQRFGFELDPDMPVAQLSIGQRQQLEFTRLLAQGVHTIILDEPTTGISAEQKTILFDALRELAQRDSHTVLLVSHKLEDVIALCHEVAVLRAGRVVGTRAMPATPAELVTLMFGQALAPAARPPARPAAQTEVLALRDVHLRGRRVTVERLSLRVRAGEIIGLAGLDGSGQELVLRACVGLVRCRRGKVTVNGQNMTGRVYHHFLRAGAAFGAAGRLEEGLVAGLSLTEHVVLASSTAPLIDWERAHSHTAAQIAQYNVVGQPSNLVENLSGGNQQRLLMALMPPAPLYMVLEQPTRGLDVDSARWIWQRLLDRREQGTAVLFSSPDLDELVTYSDRILVFFAGHAFEIPDASRTTIDELGHLIGGDFTRSQQTGEKP